MDTPTLIHAFVVGATLGVVQLLLAWTFFKLIADRQAMWLASFVSIAFCAVGIACWAMRSAQLADRYYDTLVFTWLGILALGLAVASVIRHKALS